MPQSITAPIGRMSRLEAKSAKTVSWLLPPETTAILDAVELPGNAMEIAPFVNAPCSVGAAVPQADGKLLVIWCKVNPGLPPPAPPPGPVPPSPPAVKAKLFVSLIYDTSKADKSVSDLVASQVWRRELIKLGHIPRSLELSTTAVKSLGLSPWISKAGGTPCLVMQYAEAGPGVSRGAVAAAVAAPVDDAGVIAAVKKVGG